ncbi:MAG TPA: ABC transporter permease [Dehalococcoidia bacterium]|nr:ABC transporter permease [Dehalococcoidia bacterium]
MTQYALRRVILLIPTLLAMSIALFIVIRVLPPQDAVERELGEARIDNPEAVQKFREELGLTGSLLSQYMDWLTGVLTGDLGKSIHTRRAISEELTFRIPVSFELSIIGLFFTWAISFPLGVLSAVFQDKGPDYILRGGAYLLDSIPGFVVGILVLTYLAVYFQWAPPTSFSNVWDDPVRHVKIMLLPTLIIAVGAVGNLIRFTRTFLLEVLRQDYIRTARAKGLPENTVLARHAMKNVALPFVTIIGGAIPGLLTSSVIIENLFSLPGMGRYLTAASVNLDYPVVMTTTMFFAVITLSSQLLVDLSYAWLDPRVSYASGGGRRRGR